MSQPENALAVVCKTIATPEFQQKVAQALPPGISLDRFTRTALTAIQIKPDVVRAERQSLYNSIVTAAQQGLLPDGREGAIVLYRAKDGNNWVEKAQFQPMVAGVIKRFGEAGILAYAASVYANDKIRVWNDDTGQHVTHEPVMFGERGAFIGVFAVARTSDGRTYVEAMTLQEIDKVKAASRSKDRDGNTVGPWKDWPERMAQKSALHRLGRRVPFTGPDDAAARLAEVVGADRDLYDFDRTTGEVTQPTAQAQPEQPAGPRKPSVVSKIAERAPRQPATIDGEATRVEDPQALVDAERYPDADEPGLQTAQSGDDNDHF